MSILNNSNAIPVKGGGYTLDQSLRFRAYNSCYLTRTFASGNRQKYTWSTWMKMGTLSYTTSTEDIFFGSGETYFHISNGKIGGNFRSGATNYFFDSTMLIRDTDSWYHVVFAIDTTQATASNRIKIYVNNVQITAWDVAQYPPQNHLTDINYPTAHNYGRYTGGGLHWDGYMTESHFIDGQQLTPSDFGEYNENTGVWQPIPYTGTYGTTGYYLDMSTSGSTVLDQSGSSRNWTAVNMNLTTSTTVTYDKMKDVPTLTDEDTANFCVLSAANDFNDTLRQGNLFNYGLRCTSVGSFGVTSGKWYWEAQWTGGNNEVNIGFVFDNSTAFRANTTGAVFRAEGAVFYSWDSKVYYKGTATAAFSSMTGGDILGMAVDATAGTLHLYKNGVAMNSGNPVLTGKTGNRWYPALTWDAGNVTGIYANFGQKPFRYTPPTGYKKLNTYNLADSTIKKGNSVMDATLWTGNGTSQTIVNAGAFRPDLVWIKQRSSTEQNQVMDSVRGSSKVLNTNQTVAESTDTTKLTAFNSNGFSVGSELAVNRSGYTYVGWQWQAGQGSTSSNTSGSITSTVSVNTTAGFSIATYTGTGANATVGHGLGVAPAMVIVRRRNSTGNWNVRHKSITAANSLYLNLTNASQSDPTVWNSTVPTSTVFSIGTDTGTNASGGTYVAYCWAEVEGFSKFGTYIANGSANGPFIYTGFRPAFVIEKNTSRSQEWIMHDSKRKTYNVVDVYLRPDSSNAEGSGANQIDLLSNGFKIRTSGDGINYASGDTFIYMAFAENPFKNALAR